MRSRLVVLHKYLKSLRNMYLLMVCFGLLMGLLFPIYSSLFFGAGAFTPLYVAGCLAAGFAVGSFCFYIVRQVLRLHVERQHEALAAFAGAEALPADAGSDELEALIACHELMVKRIVSMAEKISVLIGHLTPVHRTLSEKNREMSRVNQLQGRKERETLAAVTEMNDFFRELLKEIEDLSVRAEEKTSISTEMSTTTDRIAESIREYSSAVMETSASIEEMATNIKETASTIQGLAKSTEQTAGSITQIGIAISNVRDSAQKAADSSEGVRQQAQGGLMYMAATLKAMREIERTNEDSFDSINRLSVHSARVGEILQVIQDVVEQTNLLSLNASIIAAQAGERGKAFAVVAEEVRSLAHRTSLSAKEIGDLVKNIQKETAAVQRTVTQGKSRVKEGVKISQQTNDALVKIESGAAEASEMVKRIAAATVEQVSDSAVIREAAEKNLQWVKSGKGATQRQEDGINHIVKSLEQMRFLSQRITTSIEEQARGNRLYLKSVLEDNERVKTLRGTALRQGAMGELLLQYIRESEKVVEQTARTAGEIVAEVEEVAAVTVEMQRALKGPGSPEAAQIDSLAEGIPVREAPIDPEGSV